MIELLVAILVSAAKVASSAAAAEFSKGAGKAAFEKLKSLLADRHDVSSLPLLEKSNGEDAFAAAIKADLDRPEVEYDQDIRTLAETLRASIEALPAEVQAAYAVDIDRIRAGRSLTFENVEGVRAKSATAGEDMSFKDVSAPAASRRQGGQAGTTSPAGPSIGTASAGRDIHIRSSTGLKAGGVAIIIAAVIGTTWAFRDDPVQIDRDVVLALAEAQGLVAVEEADWLREQIARVDADLAQLREENPERASEIDAVVRDFNAGNLVEAQAGFERIFPTTQAAEAAAMPAGVRADVARAEFIRATLFFPGEPSIAATLLCLAAQLLGAEAFYWRTCSIALQLEGSTETAALASAIADGGAEPETFPDGGGNASGPDDGLDWSISDDELAIPIDYGAPWVSVYFEGPRYAHARALMTIDQVGNDVRIGLTASGSRPYCFGQEGPCVYEDAPAWGYGTVEDGILRFTAFEDEPGGPFEAMIDARTAIGELGAVTGGNWWEPDGNAKIAGETMSFDVNGFWETWVYGVMSHPSQLTELLRATPYRGETEDGSIIAEISSDGNIAVTFESRGDVCGDLADPICSRLAPLLHNGSATVVLEKEFVAASSGSSLDRDIVRAERPVGDGRLEARLQSVDGARGEPPTAELRLLDETFREVRLLLQAEQ